MCFARRGLLQHGPCPWKEPWWTLYEALLIGQIITCVTGDQCYGRLMQDVLNIIAKRKLVRICDGLSKEEVLHVTVEGTRRRGSLARIWPDSVKTTHWTSSTQRWNVVGEAAFRALDPPSRLRWYFSIGSYVYKVMKVMWLTLYFRSRWVKFSGGKK